MMAPPSQRWLGITCHTDRPFDSKHQSKINECARDRENSDVQKQSKQTDVFDNWLDWLPFGVLLGKATATSQKYK